MTKRILAVILLASTLALVKPAPAEAYWHGAYPIVPFFGAVLALPGQILGSLLYSQPGYGPSGYGPPAYGPPPYAAYVPPPIYAPGPVYAPGAVYGPRAYYGPRRGFAPAYRGYPSRGYYGHRVVARRYGRW